MPQVTIYTTSWCPYCRSAKQFFEQHNLPYTEINIEQDAQAADFVMQANNGNRTVPTIAIEGVGVLTNPTPAQLQSILLGT